MKKTHHKLLAWQLSMQLVRQIYELTSSFPRIEKFGLTTQLRRAAVSIPSNIAEGAARNTPKEFRQFLFMARGSLAEIETQLMLSESLGFSQPNKELAGIIERLFGLLGGLISDLQP